MLRKGQPKQAKGMEHPFPVSESSNIVRFRAQGKNQLMENMEVVYKILNAIFFHPFIELEFWITEYIAARLGC